MQRFITDERTGIRYELIGDYYYPCLTVEKSPPLSKYGRLRQRYLREHKRVLYFNLLTSGKLYEHLAEIDTSARDMAEYLIKEMAKKQGVTEELKATDMMRWSLPQPPVFWKGRTFLYCQAGIIVISDEFVSDTCSFICNKSLHSSFSFCFL